MDRPSQQVQDLAPEPGPDRPTEITKRLADLCARVDELTRGIAREHERAAHREAVIDRLHAENQRLRRGELEALLAPVRGGLFRIHDRALRAAAQCRAERLAPEPAAVLLETVAEEAADVLVGVGVERFATSPGEAYDPVRHRPVAVAPVAEAWRHHTVVEVRAAGFAAAGRPVRRADVVVARHEPGPGEEPS